MKKKKAVLSALGPMAAALLFGMAVAETPAAPAPSTAAAPGSLTQNVGLYPNDFGPGEIDVSDYTPQMKKNYKVFAFKCAACHTIARPINSQFIELNAEEQAALKKEAPVLFTDKRIGLVEDKIWNRYVKRMMSKPGCPVKGEDGKQIWEFLVFDSKLRKTGTNTKAWIEHRTKLVADFKRDYLEAYEKVFEGEVESKPEDKKHEAKEEKSEKHEKETKGEAK
jgi:hypothetical protein